MGRDPSGRLVQRPSPQCTVGEKRGPLTSLKSASMLVAELRLPLGLFFPHYSLLAPQLEGESSRMGGSDDSASQAMTNPNSQSTLNILEFIHSSPQHCEVSIVTSLFYRWGN